MTPNNIVNMAVLCELDAIAVTDHNSAGNAAAVMRAARAMEAPLIVVPGIEAESSEEVHVVCLFPDFDIAAGFGYWISEGLPGIKNRPGIFGDQYFMDEFDEITGEHEPLLLTATSYGITEIVEKTRELGGVAYPAHIDRDASGILAVLGFIPPELDIDNVEISKRAGDDFFIREDLKAYRQIKASDAHRLSEMGENPCRLHVDEPTAAGIIRALKERYIRNII
jgi:PHP family Zn ribbon phosphoesterase